MTAITILLAMTFGAALALITVWLLAGAPTRAHPQYVWWSRAGLADTARLTLAKLRMLAVADTGTASPDDDATQPLPDTRKEPTL